MPSCGAACPLICLVSDQARRGDWQSKFTPRGSSAMHICAFIKQTWFLVHPERERVPTLSMSICFTSLLCTHISTIDAGLGLPAGRFSDGALAPSSQLVTCSSPMRES